MSDYLIDLERRKILNRSNGAYTGTGHGLHEIATSLWRIPGTDRWADVQVLGDDDNEIALVSYLVDGKSAQDSELLRSEYRAELMDQGYEPVADSEADIVMVDGRGVLVY